jgi:hypothetical protein
MRLFLSLSLSLNVSTKFNSRGERTTKTFPVSLFLSISDLARFLSKQKATKTAKECFNWFTATSGVIACFRLECTTRGRIAIVFVLNTRKKVMRFFDPSLFAFPFELITSG